MMQLGMLTKCICAGEQWLMKVKTFCGKGLGFFFNFKKSFLLHIHPGPQRKTSSKEEPKVLQVSDGVEILSLGYCCSLLDMIPDLCKEQQIQQKRLAEIDTASPCPEG